MFIHIPEIIDIDTYSKEITYRYLIECNFLTEATLITALKALVTNIDSLTRRVAIGGYTKPSILVNVKLAASGTMKRTKSLWFCDIYIEATWSET